jgi:gliding motility-associated-like protein
MKFAFFTVLFFLPAIFFAQKSGNIWYFGASAGLDFNTTPPTILSNGQVNTSEGSASYADPITGAIMFYTDGITVWDKTHTIMPSSVGTPMFGDPSATQSGVIVPKPGSPNLFYIFTVPSMVGFAAGSSSMCYSIVDMNLNAGNGDIISFNNPIIDSSTEKIAVIGNCGGTEYWVLGHSWASDSFYAFKVTSAGIAPPVYSTIGAVHGMTSMSIWGAAAGYMKFSSNGSKLAVCTYLDLNVLNILDFDFATGKLTNVISDQFTSNTQLGLYGCSFSPDNSKLYVSFIGGGSELYQYNMNAGSGAAILASKTLIFTDASKYYGALQNGPNGKMYLTNNSNNTSLDVINDPNNLGASCNFVPNAQSLGTAGATWGLPSIVENFLTPKLSSFNPPSTLLICKGDSTTALQLDGLNYMIFPIGNFSVSADSTKVIFYPNITTSYKVVNYGACSTNDTSFFTITVSPNPIANFIFNPSSLTLIDASVQLKNTSQNAITYQWLYQNNLVATTIDYVFPIPGLGNYCFTVIAKNSVGCKDTFTNCTSLEDTIVSSIYVPSAFSPNGDSKNDNIKVNSQNIVLQNFTIVNRFGEIVFRSTDINQAWNGKFKNKDSEIGVYYYIVNFTNIKGKQKTIKGDITLIR